MVGLDAAPPLAAKILAEAAQPKPAPAEAVDSDVAAPIAGVVAAAAAAAA